MYKCHVDMLALLPSHSLQLPSCNVTGFGAAEQQYRFLPCAANLTSRHARALLPLLQLAVRFAEAYTSLLVRGRYQRVDSKSLLVVRAGMCHRLRWDHRHSATGSMWASHAAACCCPALVQPANSTPLHLPPPLFAA